MAHNRGMTSSTTTAPRILSAAIEYGDAHVRIEPTVLEVDGKQVMVDVFVDCPEYSTPAWEVIMVVGAPLKKDGTPAQRTVKPLVFLSTLPANIQAALVEARETTRLS